MTAKVQFSGWRPGLITIRLVKLIRQETGMSLSEGKRTAEAILAREPVVIEVPRERAQSFVDESKGLGANCRIVEN